MFNDKMLPGYPWGEIDWHPVTPSSLVTRWDPPLAWVSARGPLECDIGMLFSFLQLPQQQYTDVSYLPQQQ